MAGLIIIGILLILIIWILVAPVIIFIDTRTPLLIIQWKSIAGARVLYEQDTVAVKVNVPFWKKRWTLEDLLTKKKQPKKPKKKKKPETRKKKKMPAGKVFMRIRRILGSCRVEKLEIGLGPGNYMLAGIFYPLNFMPLPGGKQVQISFTGHGYLLTKIVNRPWRIIYAWFR